MIIWKEFNNSFQIIVMRKTIQQIKRLFTILSILLSFWFNAFIQIRGKSESDDKKRAILLRQHIERLGSVFVKFGQFLSIHPTFLPSLYCAELFYLLENVPAFSSEKVIQIFKKEFNQTPDELFQSFTIQPVAAASFGQVHEALLKTGEKVAVKVQRPHIDKTVAEDVMLMRLLASILDILPLGPNKFIDLVSEFELWTKEELDYLTEALLTEEYANSVKTKRGKHIFAPKVYKKYSTKRILTTEFIEGVTISKILLAIRNNDKAFLKELKSIGFSRKQVALQIVNESLKQIYLQGFFHGDPHPANIIFTKNAQLAYIDFGICGRLIRSERITALRYSRCYWIQDWENAFEAIAQLCDTSKVKDMQKFKKEFIELFSTKANQHQIRRGYNQFRGSALIQDMLYMLQKNKAVLSPNTLLYFRTTLILRNISFFLYPEMEADEIIQGLKNISLLNLVSELPKLFSKENRMKHLAKLINFFEKEIIKNSTNETLRT